MNSFLIFLGKLFAFLWSIISLAPVQVLILLGAIFLLLIVVFRKKLRKIPMFLCMILFALFLSHLPGFMVQYQQNLAGVCEGIKISIEKLEDQQIKTELNNSKQIYLLSATLIEYESTLDKFQNSSAFGKYAVFFTHVDKRIAERTKENYETVIAFSTEGWIALGIGALFGFLFWKLISWPFKKLFTSKKEGAKK